MLSLYAEQGAETTGGYQVNDLDISTEVVTKSGAKVYTDFYITTADTYAAITGKDAPVLGKGEALAVLSVPGANDQLREGFSFQEYDENGDLTGNLGPGFTIVGECENILNNLVRNQALIVADDSNYVLMVVDNADTLNEIGSAAMTGNYYWEGRYNFAQLSSEEQNALDEAFWGNGLLTFPNKAAATSITSPRRRAPTWRGHLRALRRLPLPRRVPGPRVHDGRCAHHLLQAGLRGLRRPAPL